MLQSTLQHGSFLLQLTSLTITVNRGTFIPGIGFRFCKQQTICQAHSKQMDQTCNRERWKNAQV